MTRPYGSGWPEDDDESQDEYERPRQSDWGTLDEARAAAEESPALQQGTVLIRWEREVSGIPLPRYGWRDSDRGMDMPPGAVILERWENGRWVPESSTPTYKPGASWLPWRQKTTTTALTGAVLEENLPALCEVLASLADGRFDDSDRDAVTIGVEHTDALDDLWFTYPLQDAAGEGSVRMARNEATGLVTVLVTLPRKLEPVAPVVLDIMARWRLVEP